MERLLWQHPESLEGQPPTVIIEEPQPLAPPAQLAATGQADVWDTPPASPSNGASKASTANARPRRIWQAIALVLLCVALAATALAYFYLRRPASSDVGGAAPIPISDQKKLVDEQLAEADGMLATGDVDGAVAKLRYAVKLDPTNAEAQRKLGQALEKKGERREAIEAYREATRHDPSNAAAWRALALAQSSEGLYQDAADSYQHLVLAMGEAAVDDNLRLEFADALRLAGRTEEARALYQKVSSSESVDLAHRASEQLAQLPQPPTNDSSANVARNENAPLVAQNLPAETGTMQANNTQAAPYKPPAQITSAPAENKRPAKRSEEEIYQEAVNIVQGRDVKTIHRAELLRAYQLFQNVKSGPHSGDARKYEKLLGKEYDRRRKND
jgi:tetratricopeptide (TPR) repeat protein